MSSARQPWPSAASTTGITPGLLLVQHSGGGKANQYFLRGFDADHGTDLALSIDGVPINMVSHAHGQGFADTNAVMPEVGPVRVLPDVGRRSGFHAARRTRVECSRLSTQELS